jgi:hypothetical protein
MEAHPDYATTIAEAEQSGFAVRETTGSPRVQVTEVVSPDGKLVRVEKVLWVRRAMRFLDLEHEIGHIRQLGRFGDRPPPTNRVVESPGGRQRPASDLKGTLTRWQDTITEYHNRLVEFLRLRSRNASPELLREHARGVAAHRQLYLEKGLKGGRSPSQGEWAERHFPDIPDLVRRYVEAGGLDLE